MLRFVRVPRLDVGVGSANHQVLDHAAVADIVEETEVFEAHASDDKAIDAMPLSVEAAHESIRTAVILDDADGFPVVVAHIDVGGEFGGDVRMYL